MDSLTSDVRMYHKREFPLKPRDQSRLEQRSSSGFIACSDSGVDPMWTSLQPGELIAIQNTGNIVREAVYHELVETIPDAIKTFNVLKLSFADTRIVAFRAVQQLLLLQFFKNAMKIPVRLRKLSLVQEAIGHMVCQLAACAIDSKPMRFLKPASISHSRNSQTIAANHQI